jgi:hypothetical protein
VIFLGKDEAQPLEKKLSYALAECGTPKVVLYYDSGPRDYVPPAKLIAQSAGPFAEATVLYQYSMSTGWDEWSANHAGWQRYRRWRAANGDERPLYDAPVQQFGSDDVDLLSDTIAFALELGWDAIVSVRPGRQLMLLSHDDRVEIYRGFNVRELAGQLDGLDYWRLA